eukprot:scaffold45541_cov49-Attheya_sp.AAC.1
MNTSHSASSNEEALKRNDQNESSFIDMSVSGMCYTMMRPTVVGTNWALARPVDGENIWGNYHKGRYFLDVDNDVAFRWVLHFIKYMRLPSGLERADIANLRALALQLSFTDLLTFIEESAEQEANMQEENASRQQLLTDMEGIIAEMNTD